MLVLSLALLVALLDQVTKQVILNQVSFLESIWIIPGFFEITHIRNPGAAWGMLGGQSVLLIILSVVVLVSLVCFRKRVLSETRMHRIALGLMAGGILGNLFDRLRHGWVVDFLYFHFGRYDFPAFNLADMAITTGVFLYLVTSHGLGLKRRNRYAERLPA